MGYRSMGSGDITLKNSANVTEFKQFCEKEGIEVHKWDDGRSYELSFFEWKMYYTKKIFETLASFGDFKLEINGEDHGDVWRIFGENGKLFVEETELKWLPRVPVTNELGE